jgi:hypothetical protein
MTASARVRGSARQNATAHWRCECASTRRHIAAYYSHHSHHGREEG